MFEEQKDRISSIIDHAKEYLKIKERQFKLILVAKVAEGVVGMTGIFLLGTLLLMLFVFISLTVAFYIGEITGRLSTGFAAVSLFHLVLMIVLYIKRESWINKPVLNSVIRNLLKDDEKED